VNEREAGQVKTKSLTSDSIYDIIYVVKLKKD